MTTTKATGTVGAEWPETQAVPVVKKEGKMIWFIIGYVFGFISFPMVVILFGMIID